MKSIFAIILTLVIFLSCNKKAEKVKEEIIQAKNEEIKPGLDTKIALKFINDYCEFCNNKFKKKNQQ